MTQDNFSHTYYQNDKFRIEGSVDYDSKTDTYLTVIEMIPDDRKGGFEIFTQDYATQKKAIKALNQKVKTFINTLYAGVRYAV